MASPNNTIITTDGGIIVDAGGNRWTFQNGKIVVNGVTDLNTGGVILLAYENGLVWQMNSDRTWWSKSSPNDPWLPSSGTSVSPLSGVASPDNTVLIGPTSAGGWITDADDDHWSITSGGQVAINGVTDQSTTNVVALAYEKGLIWQENIGGLWWSKTNAEGHWSPAFGTPVSPLPAGTPAATYISGAVVDFADTTLPAGHMIQAIDDGGKAITFNFAGADVNAGSIRNAEGDLFLNINGVFTNTGTILTQPGIGNATTTINLSYSGIIINNGLIDLEYGPVGGLNAHLQVIGSGTFRNNGTVKIDGGSSADFNTAGEIFNAGILSINDAFGTTHQVETTADIVNTGTIENHNATIIQWGISGPGTVRSATFTNNGVIESLYDVSQLVLAAGAFVHAADAYTVHEYHGTLVNNGQILAVGGGDHVVIAAPLTQTHAGHIDVQSGATVEFDSTSDGGTVNLNNGMLVFAGDRIAAHPAAGASGFHSTLTFSGDLSASLIFGGQVSETFTSTGANSGDLHVFDNTGQTVADITLAGQYTAQDFSVSGGNVIYRKVAPPVANFSVANQTTGQQIIAAGNQYVGPVSGIGQEFILITSDNLNITASIPNVFIHTGSGMDAIDVSKANGNNILDGSTGSNFLIGGTGDDTFYMDDRDPTSPIFSSVVNFHTGDNATVWGVNPFDFRMLTLDNQGASGFTGLDLIFTAPGHIDTSFVLTGYSSADLANGRLTLAYGRTQDLPGLPGSQYLNVHAN